MSKKKQSDQELEQAVVSSMGSLLEKEEIFIPSREGDALFRACDLIGQKIGVKIVLPSYFVESVEGQIKEICAVSGIFYRKITLTGRWWETASQPMVAFYGAQKKPVAVSPTEHHELDFQVPDRLEKKSITEEEARKFESFAYVLLPKLPEEKTSFWSLMRFSFAETRHDFYSLLVIAGLIGILNLFLPLAMKLLFDTLDVSANTIILKQLTVGLLLVAFSKWIFSISQESTWQRLTGLSAIKLELGLWSRILHLPASFFRTLSSADLMNRYFSLKSIHTIVADHWIVVVFSCIFCFFYLIEMILFSPLLSLVGFLSFALIALIIIYATIVQIKFNKNLTTISGRLETLVQQIISGIAKIRIAGAERRFFSLWATLFAKKKKLLLRFKNLQIISQLCASVFPFISLLLIYAVALIIWKQEAINNQVRLTMGSFVGFATAFSLFISSAMICLEKGGLLLQIPAYWNHGKTLVEEPQEARVGKKRLQSFEGGITLDHVSYRYDKKENWTVEDLSLCAKPGEMVAIVGSSGAGKSTILRLILGFEKPDHGGIFFDEHNLDDLDPSSIRAHIGTVLQSTTPLQGTIYDNIADNGNYSSEQVKRALHLSGFEEDIKDLPMGLDTVISMGGTSLSRGQRQRLLLARALVSSPQLLLLDEATSALDNTLQDVIADNLKQLGITRIVIAHRLRTIKDADRIYVLEKGKIVEVGTFQELSQKEGPFATLLKHQGL